MHKLIRILFALMGGFFLPILPSLGGVVDLSDAFPFNIETMPQTRVFEFQIGAAGTFYVDWGDGTPVETIVNENPATTYNKEEYDITDGVHVSHTYDVARSYTIKIGGLATAYSVYDGENEPPAAISFVSNLYTKYLWGSLGAIFPTLGNTDGLQPRFVDTFYGNRNLAYVPDTLFNGVYGHESWQFRSTLERCVALKSIPVNLFANATGAAPQMFRSTFYNDTGLLGIPDNLFANIHGTAPEMFMYTFYGCANLPDWLPAGLFPDNSDDATDMFYSTFSNGVTPGTCPENMYRDMPVGATWGLPVFCTPCPENTISAPGAVSVKQCYRGCDANQYFDIDTLECLSCPAGSTSNGMIADRRMCKCTAGKYMNATADACTACPDGYSNSVVGAANESQCYLITQPGEYVVTPRALPVSCPLGKYCPGGAKIYYSDNRYKPAAWIKSDGHAYIDTGLVTRPEYDYELVTTLDGVAPNESRGLFGGRANTSDAARCDFFTSTNEGDMRYDRFGTNTKLSPVLYNFINDGEFHNLTFSASGHLYVDNIAMVMATPNVQNGRFNLALFGINTGGVVDFIDDVNKITSYKVIDSSTQTVVQEFVPMYDTVDGEYCMYDIVSAICLKNAGTGHFLGEVNDTDDSIGGILPCPNGYTDRPDTGAIEIGHCQAKCADGTYMPKADGVCVNVGAGYYSPAHLINYGNASPTDIRKQCPAGLTTIGTGAGANEVGDCGRKIKLGTSTVYLRSEKRTSPSLCVDMGTGETLYLDTVLGCVSGHLCATWTDGKDYAVYNPDIDN